jgi:hypothetical protein
MQKPYSLKNDILNGPKHIFGCHDQCPSYFCNGPKTDEENLWIVFKNSEVFSDFNKHLTRVANNITQITIYPIYSINRKTDVFQFG